MRLRHRHHRQPRLAHQRHVGQLGIGLDRHQGHRLRHRPHRLHVDAHPVALLRGRIRIGLAHHLHHADDLLALVGVVEERPVALLHGLQIVPGRVSCAPRSTARRRSPPADPRRTRPAPTSPASTALPPIQNPLWAEVATLGKAGGLQTSARAAASPGALRRLCNRSLHTVLGTGQQSPSATSARGIVGQTLPDPCPLRPPASGRSRNPRAPRIRYRGWPRGRRGMGCRVPNGQPGIGGPQTDRLLPRIGEQPRQERPALDRQQRGHVKIGPQRVRDPACCAAPHPNRRALPPAARW